MNIKQLNDKANCIEERNKLKYERFKVDDMFTSISDNFGVHIEKTCIGYILYINQLEAFDTYLSKNKVPINSQDPINTRDDEPLSLYSSPLVFDSLDDCVVYLKNCLIDMQKSSSKILNDVYMKFNTQDLEIEFKKE